MRHQHNATRICCALCLALMLITMGFGSCATRRWQLLTTGTAAISNEPPISALAFTDANHGWAVTPAQLLETMDGGQTWTERLTGEGKAFHSLAFVSPTTGWIVGSQRDSGSYKALIMQTTDGGKTWQPQVVNVAPQQEARVAPQLLSVSFCNPSVGWAVGSNVIVHTANGGQTWETQHNGNRDESLHSVECVSPERAWTVGQDGIILRTEDGGTSWTRQESGTKATLGRVRFFGDSGWVVGLDGTLLQTRDGGAKWERQRVNLSKALFDIYINGRQGWIVGADGTILYTDDGGQTWQGQKSPTSNDLVSLFFINPHRGWAGGDKRTLLRFSD